MFSKLIITQCILHFSFTLMYFHYFDVKSFSRKTMTQKSVRTIETAYLLCTHIPGGSCSKVVILPAVGSRIFKGLNIRSAVKPRLVLYFPLTLFVPNTMDLIIVLTFREIPYRVFVPTATPFSFQTIRTLYA